MCVHVPHRTILGDTKEMISLRGIMKSDNHSIDLSKFPSTRYQGSKRKILPWIHDNIKDLKFETALDAFGGSGSVSYLLKKMGKAVTYNDALHFNYLTGKALIENDKFLLSESDILNLTEKSTEIEYSDFIEKNFRGIYYLPRENKWLDMVVSNIDQMNHYKPQMLEYKKALAYHALFQASLIKRPFNLFHRKNLNIRTADVERNFGNKTTWDTPFKKHFENFATETNQLVFKSGKKCSAINQSIFDIDESGYDLVYFDPPYLRADGSNESSNYLKCYHFLEGMSKYNEWRELIDFESINHRFKNSPDISTFNESTIYEDFEELVVKFRKSKIVISYKKGGVPSINHLVKLVKKVKGNAHTASLHYKYALNHQNGNAKLNREVLIIGT